MVPTGPKPRVQRIVTSSAAGLPPGSVAGTMLPTSVHPGAATILTSPTSVATLLAQGNVLFAYNERNIFCIRRILDFKE